MLFSPPFFKGLRVATSWRSSVSHRPCEEPELVIVPHWKSSDQWDPVATGTGFPAVVVSLSLSLSGLQARGLMRLDTNTQLPTNVFKYESYFANNLIEVGDAAFGRTTSSPGFYLTPQNWPNMAAFNTLGLSDLFSRPPPQKKLLKEPHLETATSLKGRPTTTRPRPTGCRPRRAQT